MCSPNVWTMPHCVLNEFLELVDPLSFQHVFFDALDCDHKPGNILNKNIVSCDEEFFLLDVASKSGQQLLLFLFVLSGGSSSLAQVIWCHFLWSCKRPNFCHLLNWVLGAVWAWQLLVFTNCLGKSLNQSSVLIRYNILWEQQAVEILVSYFSLAVVGEVLVIHMRIFWGIHPDKPSFSKVFL